MKLTKLEERIARAIMCAIFPANEKLTVPIGEMNLEEFCAHAVGGVPFKPSLGFRAMIWFTLFAPIFVLGRFRTFMGCNADERDKVVSALISSRIYEVRALFVFFKAFTSLYFFTSEKLRAECTHVLQEKALNESGPRAIAAQSLVRKEAV